MTVRPGGHLVKKVGRESDGHEGGNGGWLVLSLEEGAALSAVAVCKEFRDGQGVELNWETVPVVIGTDTSAGYARSRSVEERWWRWGGFFGWVRGFGEAEELEVRLEIFEGCHAEEFASSVQRRMVSIEHECCFYTGRSEGGGVERGICLKGIAYFEEKVGSPEKGCFNW